MKLLFICGASANDGELSCPSWVRGILSLLTGDCEIAILSPEHTDNAAPINLSVGEGSVRLFSAGAGTEPERFINIIKEEKPDVTVIFGSESNYSLSALTLCERAGILDSTVIFMQGLARLCADHYADGVPDHVIRRYTLRDVLRRENISAEQKRMQARAEDEEKVIKKARRFIGRTSADRALILSYNPTAAYYHCGDILRDCFYDGVWRAESCEKRRIFISQYYYPIKGFHYLLEAASGLREKYPDIRIAAAGYNPILGSVRKRELKDSSYIRYIKSLIRRFGLAEHIELLGQLSDRQMKEEYLRANVFVLPSTIENSPNSLGEAMMLGVPCIAADVGGVADFADHKKSAWIYPPGDTGMLARCLDELFADTELAARIGANGRERAAADYDRAANAKALEEAFKKIAEGSE